jgi:predicted metal-dependent phosphoesterase TrpH
LENNPFRADLHMHSTASDGTNSPKELIDIAKKIGLQGISITDHDTAAAYTDDLISYAREEGIILLPGVEFSSRFEDISVHILGYNIDPLSESILDLSLRHVERRMHRNLAILEKLEEKGMTIDMSELMNSGKEVIGRPHIAKIMVEKGYVPSIQKAFDLYIGDDKCCFVLGKPFSVAETIDTIHASGGKAFFAHPHLCKKKKQVRKILEKHAFNGVEVYYAKLPPTQEKEWLEMTKELGLLISGGSDFHGDIKPLNSMGSSWVDLETFKRICE